MLGKHLLAVGSFSEPVLIFTLFAERGGVLSLIGRAPLVIVVVGYAVNVIIVRLWLVRVNVDETKVCSLAPFLVAILLNLKLIQVYKHCFKCNNLLPNLILAKEVLVALLNGVQQHHREEAVANSLY